MRSQWAEVSVVLWHIPLSHYNEKARWALDFKRVPHARRVAPAGLYPAYAAIVSRGRTRRTPVLVLDGEPIGDSTAIIAALEERFPDPPLYPADPAERERALALEDFFDEELAPAVRAFAWHHLLREGKFADALIPEASARRRRAVDLLVRPVAAPAFRHDMGADETRAAGHRAKVVAAMDHLEAELDGGLYLVGDRFTVGDLAAAALFTPLLEPPNRPHLPRTEPPAAVAELRDELTARPGGRWILETYARHR